MTIFVAVAGLLLLLTLGVPIFVALGGWATVLLLQHGMPPVAVAQVILDKLNSNGFVAIPFFVLSAGLMERGGMVQALVRAAEGWLGGLRGGLALVCIVATMLFAAISGSSVATALAMSTALAPALVARKYPRGFTLGLIGASGTLGILIPPSLMLIIYGIIAEESIPRLFLAGVIPGLLQGFLFALFVLFFSYRRKIPITESETSEAFKDTLKALPALSVPIVVFVGIYGGYTTIAEAAALAAALSMLVSKFSYNGFEWRELPEIITVAMRRAAVVVLIIMGAVLFSHWLTESGAPQRLVQVISTNFEPWQFLLLMNGIMLVMGTMLEGISIILITVPLLIPILNELNINLIHYAIIVVINIELAVMTPPVGLNLFVLASTMKTSIGEVARGAVPFVLLMLLLLMIVTFFPQLSLWLPEFVFSN